MAVELDLENREYIEIAEAPEPTAPGDAWITHVVRQRSLPGYRFLQRVRPMYRYFIVTGGTAIIKWGVNPVKATRGTVFVLQPYRVIDFVSCSDALLSSSIVGVAGPGASHLYERLQLDNPFLDAGDNLQRIDVIVREMFQEATHRHAGCEWKLQSLMWDFFTQLLRSARRKNGKNDKARRTTVDPRVERVLEYVALRHAQKLTTKALAEIAGLSRPHFSTLFTQNVGATPKEYVQSVRIEKAKELLGTTDLPVQVVGARVGFTSPPHFSRRFAQREGVSPLKYRERIQAANLGQGLP